MKTIIAILALSIAASVQAAPVTCRVVIGNVTNSVVIPDADGAGTNGTADILQAAMVHKGLTNATAIAAEAMRQFKAWCKDTMRDYQYALQPQPVVPEVDQ